MEGVFRRFGSLSDLLDRHVDDVIGQRNTDSDHNDFVKAPISRRIPGRSKIRPQFPKKTELLKTVVKK